jgi:hypothetical protein
VKNQLYEQQKKKKATSEEMTFILDRYVNRWQQWVEHRSRWVLLYDSQRLIMHNWPTNGYYRSYHKLTG